MICGRQRKDLLSVAMYKYNVAVKSRTCRITLGIAYICEKVYF